MESLLTNNMEIRLKIIPTQENLHSKGVSQTCKMGFYKSYFFSLETLIEVFLFLNKCLIVKMIPAMMNRNRIMKA